MQTLTAGSFLNLENDSTVESLKHTARRLAEHTAAVVKENLTAAALENLANTLWQKAEYVARETERRRLHQIFVENFSERFRELKPEAAQAQNSDFGVSPAEATTEIAASEKQSPAPVIVANVENESATNASENAFSSVSPCDAATVAEGKKDEFLGFVESGEPFDDARATDASATAATAATTTVLKETAPTIVQAGGELAAESSKPENQSSVENPNPVNQVADTTDRAASPTAENPTVTKTEATVAASVESKPTTTTAVAASAGKNGANQAADGREPFEFEKCTINLNLTLLPAESGKNTRRVIIGATSHNLPPEIEFLEIKEDGDLTQIADLVREKLARFKQTLPVKYIEQLRQSKNKSAKKSAPTKATTAAATAAPTQTAINQTKAEIPSSLRHAQEASSNETVKPQTETTAAESSIAASTVAPPTVSQSVAANSIQGNLF